jgi:hypothetical protein
MKKKSTNSGGTAVRVGAGVSRDISRNIVYKAYGQDDLRINTGENGMNHDMNQNMNQDFPH